MREFCARQGLAPAHTQSPVSVPEAGTTRLGAGFVQFALTGRVQAEKWHQGHSWLGTVVDRLVILPA